MHPFNKHEDRAHQHSLQVYHALMRHVYHVSEIVTWVVFDGEHEQTPRVTLARLGRLILASVNPRRTVQAERPYSLNGTRMRQVQTANSLQTITLGKGKIGKGKKMAAFSHGEVITNGGERHLRYAKEGQIWNDQL